MKKHLLTLLALAALTSATVAQVPSYVPTNGLAGWYPFNGNSSDESGNGNHLTNNGPTLTFDRFGNCNSAYNFTQNQDLFKATPNTNGQNFTWSLWIKKINTNIESHNISESSNNSSTGGGFSCVFNTPQFICQGIQGNVTNSSASILNDVWYHYVITKNGSLFSIYVNGILSSTGNSSYASYNASTWFKIGAGVNLAEAEIDDVAMWNQVLNQSEIQALYTGQTLTPPTATITPNGSTTICSGGFVQLTASAGSSYLWSNGATTQSITVTQAGPYSVSVTNNDGCSATSQPVNITVNQTPSSGVTVGGATTFCTGGSLTLTAQGTGSYIWSNGATSQSITATQGGNYSVTVTNNGCSATSGVTTVTVNPTPTASIAPQGNTTFCQGGFVVLQASGGGTYQWNTGAQSSSINVTQGGTYTVQVSQNGCTAQAQQQVTVNTLPSVSLAPISSLCANANAVQLSGGSPAGGSYAVNGTPATSFDPSQTGSGTQTVAYTYTDGNGCFNTATQSATVNAVPSVSLSGLNTAYLPTDAPVQLSGSPTGGVFNGTGVSGSTFSPATAGLGTHGVSYAVVNGSGCIGVSAICTTVDLTTGGPGIGVDNGGSGVEIYPNPANGLYNLMLEQMEGIVTAKVYDAQGREVWANTIVANGSRSQHSIDISTHAKGIYTLQLQTTQGAITRKLVKN